MMRNVYQGIEKDALINKLEHPRIFYDDPGLFTTIDQQINRVEQSADADTYERFFVANLAEVDRLHNLWKCNLPFVAPYYAVKCNSDPTLLRHLAHLGFGFDCASAEEIRSIINLRVPPSKVIFANPCKGAFDDSYANSAGVRMTTFDNFDELDTIKANLPDAELLLRIYADDSTATTQLSRKYGAPMESIYGLLSRAKDLGLNVVGVSFHVGSGGSDPVAFKTAILDARIVWSIAQNVGFELQILDIGGGFPTARRSFELVAIAIMTAVTNSSFPRYPQIIAEPGQFFAHSVFTLVCRVISRRKRFLPSGVDQKDMLYQNDGVYCNFMNALTVPGISYKPTLIKSEVNAMSQRDDGKHEYIIWGPTCDSNDCVSRGASFPCEVFVKDWLVYRDMGAYTSSTCTNFNGFLGVTKTVYMGDNVHESMGTES